MGLLDGGLARIMTPAFAAFYLDGTLHAGTGDPIYDPDTGEIIGYEGGDVACKAQIDAATDAMRRAEGFAEGDVRLIILALGLPEVTSDHEVSVSGVRYRLQSAERDPVASHWVCRGRKASELLTVEQIATIEAEVDDGDIASKAERIAFDVSPLTSEMVAKALTDDAGGVEGG